jgi:hypothetical protein
MNADLQGNINLQDPEAGKAPVFKAPPVPPQYPGSQPQTQQQPAPRNRLPTEWRNLNTLDEPVCETIVREYDAHIMQNRRRISKRSGTSFSSS